ncbi:uncharacterized protein BX663DRAFT_571681 [Cokeromyces recurvatus]|uniref:uncharacterized protein n=1 Tax=Cokeromyces recurvatus TaxID=90255 RepID=UPI00221ECB87|nr:uncharacterized protein BX663DRAFT_571681 [Cokeromyces recurvatus]KAI7901686.1 hypothetical protein BX663DRAFT_571681 [Cokeromyces recurvatus]
MCKNLKERSMVNKVFVSVCCNTNDELSARDQKRNEKRLSKINADGDMQDILWYISTKKKVVIVAIDFSGLTTNQEDLK